jgi:acetyl-CoA carboxylase biotin carboxyl carrier protein
MMDVKDLKRLMDAMAAAGVAELEFEWDGSEERPGGRVALRRTPPVAPPDPGPAAPPATVPATAPAAAPGEAGPAAVMASLSSGSGASASPGPTLPHAVAVSAAPPTGVEVLAPIVGTYYAAASPDAADFVRVGDRVKVGQVLCIIEAMKLMNEIEAEVAGTVVEILVRNEDPVEYGQPLFRIAPG